jgi:hypothetical protein
MREFLFFPLLFCSGIRLGQQQFGVFALFPTLYGSRCFFAVKPDCYDTPSLLDRNRRDFKSDSRCVDFLDGTFNDLPPEIYKKLILYNSN